jgi:hypothetical protein
VNMKMPEPAFKPGDIVCWTNEYGVKWHGRRILRLENPDEWGHRYYLEPHDAHWMYVREQNLSYESLSLAELQAVLAHDGSLRRRCGLHPNYMSDISLVIEARMAAVAEEA